MAGRKTKYKKEYDQKIIDYFLNKKKLIEGDTKNLKAYFPTLIRFALEIWVCPDTITEWEKVHPSFYKSVRICLKIQEVLLLENALLWNYYAPMAQFILKNNHWYKDKTEVDNDNKIEISFKN